MADSLLERLKAVPQRPGVYIMRNEQGDVIYVGKAASLRNRVRIYFGAPHEHGAEDAGAASSRSRTSSTS